MNSYHEVTGALLLQTRQTDRLHGCQHNFIEERGCMQHG